MKTNTPKTTPRIDPILENIAKTKLGISTLREQNSDRLDFHEVGAHAVRNALLAAYKAGRHDARQMTKTNANNALEIGDDLRITKTPHNAIGGWVAGTIAEHNFQALLLPEHADYEYELGESRIYKLWLERIADKTTVANFFRGWDIEPATATARAIVNFLAAGLAELVYHK